MAIADAIESIKQNVANAYNTAASKGATIPVNRNMENLPPTIASIPTGGGGDYNVESVLNDDGTQTLVINSATSSKGMEMYKALLDGSLTSFKVPAGVTTLKGYRFYDFKNLKEVDLTGITEIPDYLCFNCGYIEKLTLDKNTTKIGNYAFRQTGNVGGVAGNFEFHPVNSCYLGNEAFSSSKLTKISGEFNSIQNNALSNIDKLTDVNIKINGQVNSLFSNCYNVENFFLDPESNITIAQSQNMFTSLGSRRSNPENNVFEIDLRNSTFTSLSGYYTFAGNGVNNVNRYLNIQLPATVTALSNKYNARFVDHCNFWYNSVIPPTLGNNAFYSSTNYKNFVPYNAINAYKTATNWTTVADSIYGFVNENTLETGYVLPTTNDEGLNLKWYSNVDMTNAVTAVGDTTIKYYCKVV